MHVSKQSKIKCCFRHHVQTVFSIWGCAEKMSYSKGKVKLILIRAFECSLFFSIMQKRYEFLNVYLDPEKYPPLMPDHKARILAVGWIKQHGKKKILTNVDCYGVFERSFKSNGGGWLNWNLMNNAGSINHCTFFHLRTIARC